MGLLLWLGKAIALKRFLEHSVREGWLRRASHYWRRGADHVIELGVGFWTW